MSNLRAITLKQPWAFSLCHAGMDVINQPRPVPPKLLERLCAECGGVGWTEEAQQAVLLSGDPSIPVEGDDDCIRCGGTSYEPLVVAIHAGATRFTHRLVRDMNALEVPYSVRRGGRNLGDDLRYRTLTDREAWWKHADTGNWGMVPTRSIVAVAQVESCHEAHAETSAEPRCCQSEWGQFGVGDNMYHWQLANVRVLPEPVTGVRGWPGLWTPLQEDLQKVLEQL